MWVYLQSEPGLWTVGFYKPSGKWEAESDHKSEAAAAARVHYLNGGKVESCAWCPDPKNPDPYHHPSGQIEHVTAYIPAGKGE